MTVNKNSTEIKGTESIVNRFVNVMLSNTNADTFQWSKKIAEYGFKYYYSDLKLKLLVVFGISMFL